MTSKDEFQNVQGFWKKLSGEDQSSTVSGIDKNKDTTTDGVTYSAPFTMNSNKKVKNKGVDKYMSDERAEIVKEIGRVIDAIHSFVMTSKDEWLMTSKDEFQNIQGFWKKLSGGDQSSTVSGKDKNKDRTIDGVTYSAPLTMNFNNKVKHKGDDKYMSDERAEIAKGIQRITDPVNLMGCCVRAVLECQRLQRITDPVNLMGGCVRAVLECQPVVDILSVRLLCNNPRNEPLEICGVIFIFDHLSHICFIHERDEFNDAHANDLEVIPVDGNGVTLRLSFTGPDDVMSMNWPDICVNVKDYVTGEVIVKGFAQLSMTAEDTVEEHNHSFEQFRTITIHGNGNGCSAVVEYLVLTYGVLAYVEVKLCGGKDEEEEEDFLVYGKISVDYNLYHCEERVISITLFEIKEDSRYFERTTLDSPITLSRSVVAVPAYSSLTVRVDLWSEAKNEPIVQGSFAFDTGTDNHAVDEIIPGLNCTNAKITVHWREPYYQGSTPQVHCPILPNASRFGGWHMVEMFSLFIGHQNDKDLNLYGMINFCGQNVLNIFKRDRNDPYILSRGCNFLPLQIFEEALVPGDCFYVSVDLEDVEGLVWIKGLVIIDLSDEHQKEEWYNKLLCNVIKGVGNRSFAALHYTVFSHAASARLKVQFYFESKHFIDDSIRIYGGLVLRYGEYGIRTQYEKKYHRCVLFKRHKENPLVKFGNDFDLELSRSLVAVPCNSSVIIVADLSCCLSSGITAYLRETKEFQIGTENVKIDGDECSLKIAVKWS